MPCYLFNTDATLIVRLIDGYASHIVLTGIDSFYTVCLLRCLWCMQRYRTDPELAGVLEEALEEIMTIKQMQ
jgi:hypothetical protein